MIVKPIYPTDAIYNRRILAQSGFFGSFDAPWSEWSSINLFNKEKPFLDFRIQSRFFF